MARVWRVGHRSDPCGFVPRHLYKWYNRFDDSQKKYRTLYCANSLFTCLRELLADLRPNTRAIADFETCFGASSDAGLTVAGVVSWQWRQAHGLVNAETIIHCGKFADIESLTLRREIEHRHPTLLRDHGFRHFDLSEIRARDRPVTQAISRGFFDEGRAGVRFASRLDGLACYALFEGRASLKLCGKPIPLTKNIPELVRVCGEFTLVLRPA